MPAIDDVLQKQLDTIQKQKTVVHVFGFVQYELGYKHKFTVPMIELVDKMETKRKLVQEYMEINDINEDEISLETILRESRKMKINHRLT